MSIKPEFLDSPKTAKAQLMKLRIESYQDPEQSTANDPKDFEALYNPANFAVGYALKYADKSLPKATKRDMRYDGYDPTTYSFELLLDGTGASLPGFDRVAAGGKVPSVTKMLAQFKAVAYGYVGDAHRPSYLKLIWGETVTAKCVLASANVTFDLFSPDGSPLRCKIACQFKEYSYEELSKAEEKDKSPDMTHMRVVQQGDRLPLMCERIYGDSRLYLQVARFNNLKDYRNLEPGQKLYFPPLTIPKA